MKKLLIKVTVEPKEDGQPSLLQKGKGFLATVKGKLPVQFEIVRAERSEATHSGDVHVSGEPT